MQMGGMSLSLASTATSRPRKNRPPRILLVPWSSKLYALGSIPGEIDDAFQKAKKEVGSRVLLVPEVLKAAPAPLERAYICIDAVDECLPKHLPELLRSLHGLSQQCHGIRLFITGQPYVLSDIKRYFPGGARFLDFVPKGEDIRRYLERMLLSVDKINRPPTIDSNTTLLITLHFQHHLKKLL
ncbi:hypothetical protein L873DRAFT_1804716 [Choiromyces venosus 120613-1]|uniref:NACHT domain-containing protein n=1 Tax=Choiromyces venosus 120613-1 TaxID=1336337 RepID=A0A3N4JQU9_9PEZI|nr:hypothetical protein L873DRAFT_1804716 [Choiromyces venosus 120613-1]